MRISFWDVLSIMGLLTIGMMVVLFIMISIKPNTFLNPFPPASLPAVVVIPSSSPTSLKLPPTWTLSGDLRVFTRTLAPSQTMLPSSTFFQLPTYTLSPTNTYTPTNTPTITNTPTKTKTITSTRSYTPSDTPPTPTEY